MKTSRAYIAGLGTTGILLASSVLLLFVVGAVVAFKGTSVRDGLRELEELVVDNEQRPVGLSGPALVAAEAAPTAGGVSADPPAGVAAGGPGTEVAAAGPAGSAPGAGGATPGAPGAPSGTPGGSGGDTFVSPPGTTGGGGQSGAGAGAGGGQAPQVGVPGTQGQTLGDTTQGVTDGLGRVVDGVDPRLGDTVRGLGDTAGGLVDGLTGG